MKNLSEQAPSHWAWTGFVYFAAIGLFVTYGRLSVTRSIYDNHGTLTSIELINPFIQQFVGWSALVVAIWILLAVYRGGWLRWRSIGLLIGIGLYPYCVLRHAATNLAPWTYYGTIATDDGRTFHFCESSFLQGQTMTIAEIADNNNLKTTLRVLAHNNGDSPRSWASVIRPNGAIDAYGQLYLKHGFLIGFRFDHHCYLAYDLRTGKSYGHGDIELLSPFLCLEASDVPNAIDIQRTCDRITHYATLCESASDIRLTQSFLNGECVPGCPQLCHLRSVLGKEPEATAAAATRILACYDAAFARLKKRLSLPSDDANCGK